MVIEVETGNRVLEFDTNLIVESIEYNADNSSILIGSRSGETVLFDAQTGELLQQFQPTSDTVGALQRAAISPDGTLVAAAFGNFGIFVWDKTLVNC